MIHRTCSRDGGQQYLNVIYEHNVEVKEPVGGCGVTEAAHNVVWIITDLHWNPLLRNMEWPAGEREVSGDFIISKAL